MKVKEKMLYIINIVILLCTIVILLVSIYFIYTRINYRKQSDLLDAYNFNLIFIFIIGVLGSDRLKLKYAKILSLAGVILSAVSLFIFTVPYMFH